MTTVAVVGVGKLGEALVAGLLRSGQAVVGAESSPGRAAEMTGRYGIDVLGPAAAAARADVVLVAVKPTDVRATVASLQVRPDVLVVSLAAGVPTSAVEAELPSGTPVVRVMTNTPAFVGAGMSALSAGTSATDASLDLVEGLLRPLGRVVRVEESQQDAVTAVSGSGPAYFFRVVEAMATAGEVLGLAPDVALELARQTLVGAGRLLGESPLSPAELRQAVTSPGGTTAAALAVLDERGIDADFLAALTAARDRSAQLATG